MARYSIGSEQHPPPLSMRKKLMGAKRKKAKAPAPAVTPPKCCAPPPPSPAKKRKAKRRRLPASASPAPPTKVRGLKRRRVTCFICFEKIPLGKPYQLKCKHSGFHKACILQWLRRSGRCPLCDTEFPEYVRQPAPQKLTMPAMHHLPLSVLCAYPEFAQSLGVPILYAP
eukprot:EG_transcript_24376